MWCESALMGLGATVRDVIIAIGVLQEKGWRVCVGLCRVAKGLRDKMMDVNEISEPLIGKDPSR